MQYTFSTQDKNLIEEIDKLAERTGNSRSQMIDLLLHAAVKERNRKKKKITQFSPSEN